MTYYRLYFLDEANHIKHFGEFEAFSDAVALEQANEWRQLNAMELWSGRRKVKRWEALCRMPEARARTALKALRLAAR